MKPNIVESQSVGTLLTMKQACDTLSVSRGQLYRMIWMGAIQPVKIGPRGVRIRSTDVERIVREGVSARG
jgi:excisionase family DNA binding protein